MDIQGPFSVAPCQTLISSIRNFFIAVRHPRLARWLLRWVLLTACLLALAALLDLVLVVAGSRGAPFEPSARSAVTPLLLCQGTAMQKLRIVILGFGTWW
jgi:hypothetical protein